MIAFEDSVNRTSCKKRRRPAPDGSPWPPSRAYLERLIKEATVDAYGDSEQRSGFLCMLEDKLGLPFEARVLGVAVIVEGVDLTPAEEIVAICRRGRERQAIPILELPLPSPRPAGAEWIAAYRHWASRR